MWRNFMGQPSVAESEDLAGAARRRVVLKVREYSIYELTSSRDTRKVT